MNLRGVLEEISKRYQFAQAPKNELDFDDQRSLSFKSGTFVGQRKVPLLVGLNIYSDGLVADTMSSTDESTEFLNDLAKWLSDTYGLTVPKERRVNYLSHIDFRSEVSLINLNRRLEAFAANLENLGKRAGGRQARGEILGAAYAGFACADLESPSLRSDQVGQRPDQLAQLVRFP